MNLYTKHLLWVCPCSTFLAECRQPPLSAPLCWDVSASAAGWSLWGCWWGPLTDEEQMSPIFSVDGGAKIRFVKLHLLVWIKLSIRDMHKKTKHVMISPSFSASIRTFFRATISSDLVSRARSAVRKGNWLFTEHVTWTNWSVSPQYFLCCLTYTQCRRFLLLFGWVSQTLWHFCSSQTEERKTR